MATLFGDEEGRPAPDAPDAAPGQAVPLATRLRPTTLDELVGQQRLLASGSALRRAIEEGRPHSMILHGPPGSGKTTLARLVANASDAAFEEESAVAAGRARGVLSAEDEHRLVRALVETPRHMAAALALAKGTLIEPCE